MIIDAQKKVEGPILYLKIINNNFLLKKEKDKKVKSSLRPRERERERRRHDREKPETAKGSQGHSHVLHRLA